jgi:predicted hotdog family 3-hydroxylacyl-ACP dehydratase
MNALDQAAIAQRVPHSGSMCLLHRCETFSADHIVCSALSHHDPHNPLRTQAGLLSVAAIEYASQAMALHGGLNAPPGSAPTPGFLAAVRAVQLHVRRLDDVPGPLTVTAHKLAGGSHQASYGFALHDSGGRALVQGRATVILQALP